MPPRCERCWPTRADVHAGRTATAAPRCTGPPIATTRRWPTRCCVPARASNAATDLGATPLYLACTNHSAPMVSRLLEAGADPNLALPSGETPLMNCARTGDRAGRARAAGPRRARGRHASPRTSRPRSCGRRPSGIPRPWRRCSRPRPTSARARAIYTQVGDERGDAARRPRGAELHGARGGSTPLLFAARSGDAESARLLLDAGADANDALADGLPALTLAAYSGHGDVAAVLLERGADPNAAAIGFTALHAAVLRSRRSRSCGALLARGAAPNAAHDEGHADAAHQPGLRPARRRSFPSTPYLLAARFLEPEILRALRARRRRPARRRCATARRR